MTMLLALAATSAAAQPRQVTAEEAAEIHRETFSVAGKRDCAVGADPEEIVVCGKTGTSYRIPYVPEPGARVANDSPNGMSAMSAGGCLRLCHQPVSVDLLKVEGGGNSGGAVVAVPRVIRRILGGD